MYNPHFSEDIRVHNKITLTDKEKELIDQVRTLLAELCDEIQSSEHIDKHLLHITSEAYSNLQELQDYKNEIIIG